MKHKTVLLLSAALIAFPINSALAGERYSAPKAITLSPDLTSPWILQLRQAPKPRYQKRKKAVQANALRQQRTESRWKPQKRKPVRATGIFAAFNTQPTVSQQRRRSATPRASNAAATAYIQQQSSQRSIDPQFLPRTVSYSSSHKPGTIIINTQTRHLYYIMADGKARRYGVGVGKAGFEWTGSEKISRKAEWPSWRPPAEMIVRERKNGRELPAFMEGGPANPLGARALYLGSTLYRIHGTNQPWTIGQAVSSGCIRMRNEDVMDLYERARVGAKVVVI